MSHLPHNGSFTLVLDSHSVAIGEEQPVWRDRFRTPGRRTDNPAFLKLSVRGLTRAEEPAEVAVNGQVIGGIGHYFGLDARHWFTQIIPFDAGVLHPDASENEIRIKAVHDSLIRPLAGGPPLDEFRVKDVICMYHRNGETAFDYKVIHGDEEILLGEGPGARNLWREEFFIQRVDERDSSYLMVNTRGLTGSTEDIQVRLNGRLIGDIDDYAGQDERSWFTQMIPFDPGVLDSGTNVLEVEAIGLDGTFGLRNVVCVHQELTRRKDEDRNVFGIPIAVDRRRRSVVVGDFAAVVESPVRLGDRGEIVWDANFLTNNRIADDTACLVFNVRGLTLSEDQPEVKINGRQVGRIRRYPGGRPEHWHTQAISFDAGVLRDGNNSIEIEAASIPDSTSENFDDFWIRSMTCWFHRIAELGQATKF